MFQYFQPTNQSTTCTVYSNAASTITCTYSKLLTYPASIDYLGLNNVLGYTASYLYILATNYIKPAIYIYIYFLNHNIILILKSTNIHTLIILYSANKTTICTEEVVLFS